MPLATLDIRGREKTWAITTNLPEQQIIDMQADGVDVGRLIYSIPAGIPIPTRVWCFLQDIWNFRNPL